MEKKIYVDSHTHFDLILEEGNLSEKVLLQEMEDLNCRKAVQVSIDSKNLQWSRDFALKHQERGILFTAGIHPSSPAGEGELQILEKFLADTAESESAKLLFGIGECGLDFFRKRQPEKMQRDSFARQIELAAHYHLPVIVHSREAWRETIDIIKACRPSMGIMHCFPGDRDAAREALDLGFYLSFAGNVTFKKATHLQEAALFTPAERLLLETDAPFLTPVPHRGKPNRPQLIRHTYDFIARLKVMPLEELQETIYTNFMKITDTAGER